MGIMQKNIILYGEVVVISIAGQQVIIGYTVVGLNYFLHRRLHQDFSYKAIYVARQHQNVVPATMYRIDKTRSNIVHLYDTIISCLKRSII
jgi:hypothetical protein